ncbi:MAG: hypothetical protein LBI84_04555 [Propionibacteriaceae bacterium]|nr:hypothetical protein [Propionibacteriaceae bacterium]
MRTTRKEGERWIISDGGFATQEDVVPAGDLVLVLLTPEGDAWKPVKNLLAVTRSGDVVWRAELPSHSGGDCYVAAVVGEDGQVTAVSWSGYRVTLDAASGRIIWRTPTK